MEHTLKILPEFFEAVVNLEKTFEVRKNDRNFELDDLVFLVEWDDDLKMHTGRKLGARITYILDNPEYCKKGYVVFGFELGAGILQYKKAYKLKKGWS